ncbi:phage holin family protein [Candidatus Peregrinibacteria bacterium]|nr:phage holin family protein [Candidatus Peregrinibacteria bacterium]
MFKKILIGIILNGAALYGVIYLLPEIQYAGGIKFFVIGGLTMGILNSIVKPILKLLTLPIQIITLGLSLIILNGIIFWIFKLIIDTIALETVSITVPGVTTYIFAGTLFGLINWIEHFIIHNK